jgi:hypothetical protein
LGTATGQAVREGWHAGKGDDGRILYFPILSFDTRAVADAFSVVDAVRRLVPEAFDDVRGAS